MRKPNDIDLGLSVLCAVVPLEQRLSLKEIADVCGCSHQNIQRIENTLLKKLQRNSRLRDFHEALDYE